MKKLTMMVMVMKMTKTDCSNCLRKEMQRIEEIVKIEKEEIRYIIIVENEKYRQKVLLTNVKNAKNGQYM